MEHIYLPVEQVSDYACYSIRNGDVIRAYKNIPRVNSESDYVDFYINSHYLEIDGTQTWGNYTQNLPVCIENNSITNEVYYRNDFDSILIIFLVMCIFCFYLPYKLFMRLFKKGSI